MKKVLTILLVLAVMFSVFAGGAKEETKTQTTDEQKVQNQTAAKQYETYDIVPTEKNIVRGGKLTIGTLNDVASMAPWKFRGEYALLGGIYEPLLVVTDSGDTEPFLLEKFESNPEKLTYTLTLKKGITFSDGSPLDADAMIWNFENFWKNGSSAATHFSSVDHFEKIDDYTVVMHLKEWNSQIPFSMNDVPGLMYSKKAFDDHGYDWCLKNPVGTGPYIMDSYVKDQSIHFVPNPTYWNKEAEPPLYDEVEVIVYGDAQSAQAAMYTGDLDVFLGGDYGMKDQMVAQGYKLYQNKMWSRVYFLLFTSAIEGSPFTDVRVRQAVCYAIDSDAIIKALDYGRTYYSNQYAVEGTGFYNPNVKGYEYNPEKAKALLKEAGYGDGFKTKMVVGIDQRLERYMVAVQSYLAAVGIDVELVYLDNAAWQSTAGIYGDGVSSEILLCGHGYGANLANQALSNFSQRATLPGSVGMLHNNKIHPDDLNDAIMGAVGAKSKDEMYKYMQEVQYLLIDKYCIAYPLLNAYYTQIITQPDIVDAGWCNSFNRTHDWNRLYRVDLSKV